MCYKPDKSKSYRQAAPACVARLGWGLLAMGESAGRAHLARPR